MSRIPPTKWAQTFEESSSRKKKSHLQTWRWRVMHKRWGRSTCQSVCRFHKMWNRGKLRPPLPPANQKATLLALIATRIRNTTFVLPADFECPFSTRTELSLKWKRKRSGYAAMSKHRFRNITGMIVVSGKCLLAVREGVTSLRLLYRVGVLRAQKVPCASDI